MARARTLWEEGTRPGRQVVQVGAAATLAAAIVDTIAFDDVDLLFDLAFVAICVTMALAVHPDEFFTVGIAPPPTMVAVFWLLGIFTPGAIADGDDGALQAVITGMAHHANALLFGYALCLACLGIRRQWLQDSKRSGSPAPRRSTSGVPSE